MIYRRSKAIKVINFIIGGSTSRYPKSSFVLTSESNEEALALSQIHYFAQCSVSNEIQPIWIAAVTTHHCRSCFGFPVEVWTTTPRTPSSISFIRISASSLFKIKSEFWENRRRRSLCYCTTTNMMTKQNIRSLSQAQ